MHRAPAALPIVVLLALSGCGSGEPDGRAAATGTTAATTTTRPGVPRSDVPSGTPLDSTGRPLVSRDDPRVAGTGYAFALSGRSWVDRSSDPDPRIAGYDRVLTHDTATRTTVYVSRMSVGSIAGEVFRRAEKRTRSDLRAAGGTPGPVRRTSLAGARASTFTASARAAAGSTAGRSVLAVRGGVLYSITVVGPPARRADALAAADDVLRTWRWTR